MRVFYNFYLTKNDGERIPINPIYSDGLTLDYNRDNGQQYFRRKLKGRLKFVRNDYDAIMQSAFDTIYKVYIEKGDGQTFAPYFVGKFMRTDCTINEHDRIITTELETIDQYTDILANLENEYNFIELLPRTTQITLQVRSTLQIYVPGSDKITNIYNGIAFEQDANAEPTSFKELQDRYKFSLNAVMIEGIIDNATTYPLANGKYRGTFTASTSAIFDGELVNENGYRLKMQYVATKGYLSADLFPPQGSRINYGYASWGTLLPVTETINLVSAGDWEWLTLQVNVMNVFARLMLNRTEVQGAKTYPIPTDDIVDRNANYNYVIGYGIRNVSMNYNYSTTPTEWGMTSNGQYYTKPYREYGGLFIPIAQSYWGDASYWLEWSYFDRASEQVSRARRTVRDNYPVTSIIKVLLSRNAPNVIFEETPEYSRFLCGDNPITAQALRLHITPLSNIIQGNYKIPAQKAQITLAQIFSMLANLLKCYWHIDNNNHLHIEHLSYYENGGTYDDNIKLVEYDLTSLTEIRNGKKWAFDTSQYTFDKINMASRYQYTFGNDMSAPFIYKPIEVVSNYVQKDKVEEINIGNYTTDIDWILLNAVNVNEEGYALLAGVTAELLESPDKPTVSIPMQFGKSTDIYWLKSNGIKATLTLNVSFTSGQRAFNIIFVDSKGDKVSQAKSIVTSTRGEQTIELEIGNDVEGFKISAFSTFNLQVLSLRNENNYELPFIDVSYEGNIYSLQNGYLSMFNLIENYLLYGMPAYALRVGDNDYVARSITKGKKQNVTFPIGYDDPDINKLVQTYIGAGEYDSISININSRCAKTTLKYDTE